MLAHHVPIIYENGYIHDRYYVCYGSRLSIRKGVAL